VTRRLVLVLVLMLELVLGLLALLLQPPAHLPHGLALSF
jgi:hypothetical protein